MANAAKLKDQARAAENRDQWREAAALYRQLLEESPAEEADIALWNRVGDLHLRAQETDRAVDAYENAITAYADSGLYNNAIALCRKLLRLVPGRVSVYHKLGQISAAAGFLADARQNFLEYAERMKRAGKADEAFEALREFADVSQDVGVRRVLADQLLANGRTDDAIEQLRILLGAALQRDDHGEAQALRGQITAIDPSADATPLLRDRTAAVDDFRAALHDGHAVAAEPGNVSGLMATSLAPAEEVEVAPMEGFQSTSLDDDAAVAPMEGLEQTALDGPPEADAGLRMEPGLLDLPDGDDPFASDDDTDDDADLPLLDEGTDGGDLPLLSFDDEPAPARSFTPSAPPPAADRLEPLRAHVAGAPEDAAAREDLVRELRARGLGHEVDALLEGAHRALAARGMYFEAVAPITALIGLRPDDPLLLQKRVEYAFRSGRPEPQVEAYLDLGRYLARNGQEGKAGAVFKRVLELDPHNVEARAAAAQVAPPPPTAPPPPPPAATPAQPEYVDLGALILDDIGGQEPTTRFVVEEREPSGDEDRDFAEMLASFRQKVAENIEPEDSASHYDLGVAFMEMGLVDEAIAEFQVALRGGANPLATLELLGQCFVEKQQYAVGGRVLDRALRLPGAADGDLVGVLYLLGRIQEATGQTEKALEFYERVVAVDIRFRDTAGRVERLRAGRGTAGV